LWLFGGKKLGGWVEVIERRWTRIDADKEVGYFCCGFGMKIDDLTD